MSNNSTPLRARLSELGWTQRQLAIKIDMTEQMVRRYIAGYAVPRVSTAQRIAAALDSTVDKLWPRER